MSEHLLTGMICIAELPCASALANEGMIGLNMWHVSKAMIPGTLDESTVGGYED